MHLSEGVLHTPVLLAGVALAAIGVAVGLRRLDGRTFAFNRIVCCRIFRCRYHSCARRNRECSSNFKWHGRAVSWLGGIPGLSDCLVITGAVFFLRWLCRIGRKLVCDGVAGSGSALLITRLFAVLTWGSWRNCSPVWVLA